MDFTQLEQIIAQAVSTFNQQERFLLENDLSERCICACFATHVARALHGGPLSGFAVDVEYNRGVNGKEKGIKQLDGHPITVDLIVHRRQYEEPFGFCNLICIEMKKSTDHRGCTDDEERLRKMTDYDYPFRYQAGFMIVANMQEPLCRLEIRNRFALGQIVEEDP